MRCKKLILISFFFIYLSFTTAQEPNLYNNCEIYGNCIPIAERWNTNIGLLDGVNATQFLNIIELLNIDTSWLGEFVLSQNSSTWNRSGTDTFLANTGDNVGIGTTDPVGKLNVIGDGNFTGTLFAADLNLTSPASINFLDVTDFITKMFAQTVTVGNLTRNSLITDASSFAVLTNHPGTSLMGNINTNSEQNSSVAFTLLNHLGNGMSILKFGDNNTFGAQEAFLGNNFGNFRMTNQNQNDSNLTLGFNDGTIINILGDISGVNNQTDVIVLNNKFATIPFLTNFFFPVIFRNDTTVDSDLNVTGNFTGNQIYGGMGVSNDAGFEVDLITIDVYENITNFTSTRLNGFSFSNNQSLTAQVSGVYEVTYDVSFADTANSQLGFNVGINGVPATFTHSDRKIGTGGDVGNTGGNGIIELNVGDVVTLMARDENEPVADITISASNLKIIRIGNL